MSLHAELIARLRDAADYLSHRDSIGRTNRQAVWALVIREAADALARVDTEPRADFEAGYRFGKTDQIPMTADAIAEAYTRYQQSRTGETMSELAMTMADEAAPARLTVLDPPETALALARDDPRAVLNDAQKAAEALKGVIDRKRNPVKFGGETYLEFEDWQTVGRFYGVTAKVVSTTAVTFEDARGFECRAVAITPSGFELSAAESMCLDDEKNWRGKPLFQIRSMAQTRACGKALRNVLSWVVVLAGYRPTPAEELEHDERPPAKKPDKRKPAPPPDPPEEKSPIGTIVALHERPGGAALIELSTGFVCSTRNDAFVQAAAKLRDEGRTVELLTKPSSDPAKYAPVLEEIAPYVEGA